jgi:hypothetical protein
VRVADGEHRGGAGGDRSSGKPKAEGSDQAGDPRRKPDQGERANARDSRSWFQPAKVEPAFDADEQSASERRGDAEGLPVPAADQESRSLCQRRCSAMNVEMK